MGWFSHQKDFTKTKNLPKRKKVAPQGFKTVLPLSFGTIQQGIHCRSCRSTNLLQKLQLQRPFAMTSQSTHAGAQVLGLKCWRCGNFMGISKAQVWKSSKETSHSKRHKSGTSTSEKNKSWWYCWWFRNPAHQLRVVIYPMFLRRVL